MDERIIRAKLSHLRQSAVVERWPIARWEARTADHLAPGAYRYDGEFAPVEGEGSWPAGKTLFLRASVETPAPGPGQTVFFQFEGEGLEGLALAERPPLRRHRRQPRPRGRAGGSAGPGGRVRLSGRRALPAGAAPGAGSAARGGAGARRRRPGGGILRPPLRLGGRQGSPRRAPAAATARGPGGRAVADRPDRAIRGVPAAGGGSPRGAAEAGERHRAGRRVGSSLPYRPLPHRHGLGSGRCGRPSASAHAPSPPHAG